MGCTSSFLLTACILVKQAVVRLLSKAARQSFASIELTSPCARAIANHRLLSSYRSTLQSTPRLWLMCSNTFPDISWPEPLRSGVDVLCNNAGVTRLTRIITHPCMMAGLLNLDSVQELPPHLASAPDFEGPEFKKPEEPLAQIRYVLLFPWRVAAVESTYLVERWLNQ